MDTVTIQEFLEDRGLLTPGTYQKGKLDSSTRQMIDKLKSLSGIDDIETIIKNFNNTQFNNYSTKSRARPSYSNFSTANDSYRTSNKITKSSYSRSDFRYDAITCFITNLRTGASVDFSLESPDSISESTGANFTSTSTKGRSHPWMSYDNSKGRESSFTIALNEDYCSEGLVTTINKIKAMTYPAVEGDLIVSPLCSIKIGNTISMQSAVVTSVQVNWRKPYREGLYTNAEVTISVEEVVLRSITQSQAQGGY